MEFTVSTIAPENCPCDLLILGIPEGEILVGPAATVDQALGGILRKVVQEERFTGKTRSTLLFHTHDRIPPRRLLLVGLGSPSHLTTDHLRQAAAIGVNTAQSHHLAHIAMPLLDRFPAKEEAQAVVEGTILGSYRFRKYKRADEEGMVEKVELLTTPDRGEEVNTAIRRAAIFASATCFARDLVNEPPNELTPSRLAEIAREVATQKGIRCTIYGPEEMRQMGMGAILSVAQGSSQPPRFIVMEYTPPQAKRTVALVGKGVTFDSGGLDIKSTEGMETMKMDMAGAAAVIAAMSALPDLAPPVHVLGIAPAVENLPSGTATKPGDIVRAMDGHTIEINNTDAEGRLILADALAYAVQQGAEEIIDLATLTGSCIIALGPICAGIMGNDQRLIDRLVQAASRAGEKVWQLPLFEEYFEPMKSAIADLRNSGGRYAGAQKGALFLREFVGGKPWAHLDIAGPAFVEHDEAKGPYWPKGSGTGFGVRTLLEYLTAIAHEEDSGKPR
ncbi:MAG: leucyl aminopeptidase [Armatimonadota bacterium]|nr:leucyl aminopeptidase [Armatimonadota bacterium]MDR5702610.1 leucyl aminopeptidase [Armatimonadota bacterium]